MVFWYIIGHSQHSQHSWQSHHSWSYHHQWKMLELVFLKSYDTWCMYWHSWHSHHSYHSWHSWNFPHFWNFHHHSNLLEVVVPKRYNCKVKSNWIKEIFKGLTGGDGEAAIVCIRNIRAGLGFDQRSRSKWNKFQITSCLYIFQLCNCLQVCFHQ